MKTDAYYQQKNVALLTCFWKYKI